MRAKTKLILSHIAHKSIWFRTIENYYFNLSCSIILSLIAFTLTVILSIICTPECILALTHTYLNLTCTLTLTLPALYPYINLDLNNNNIIMMIRVLFLTLTFNSNIANSKTLVLYPHVPCRTVTLY